MIASAQAANSIREWGGAPANSYVIIQGDRSILLKEARVYKFEAIDDATPANLIDIDEIVLAGTVTSGTVTVLIGRDPQAGAGTAGAIDVKKIDLDRTGVTSVISGIDITGDLLETAAATVDSVTGPLVFGDSTDSALLNAMTIGSLTGDITVNGDLGSNVTVNDDLDGALTVTGGVASGVTLDINGKLNQPLTVSGALVGTIDILKRTDAAITLDSISDGGLLDIGTIEQEDATLRAASVKRANRAS